MASVGQAYYQVVMMNGNTYTKASNVTEEQLFRRSGQTTNLVTALGKTAFTKVGIQAPPGTQIVINESHTIIIGRSGLYELEARIESLYVKPISVYVKNIQNADAKVNIEEGSSAIKLQCTNFVNALNNTYSIIPSNKSQWTEEKYTTFMSQNEQAFTNALKEFKNNLDTSVATYLSGIAKLWQTGTPTYIENIIIDYEY